MHAFIFELDVTMNSSASVIYIFLFLSGALFFNRLFALKQNNDKKLQKTMN
jgi:hypothetical protein